MVIDADAHANEPIDLFDRYLEKEFKDHGPQGQRYPFEAIKYAVASILVGFGIETDRDYTIVGNRYYARLRRAEKRSS